MAWLFPWSRPAGSPMLPTHVDCRGPRDVSCASLPPPFHPYGNCDLHHICALTPSVILRCLPTGALDTASQASGSKPGLQQPDFIQREVVMKSARLFRGLSLLVATSSFAGSAATTN